MKYYKIYILCMLFSLPLFVNGKIYKCDTEKGVLYRDRECGSKYRKLEIDKFLERQDESFSQASDYSDDNSVDISDKIDPEKTEINVLADGDQHFRIEGYIEKEPVTFLVDTGATAVVMSIDFAEKAGLEKLEEVEINTANGEVVGYETVIKSFVLDGILLKDVEAIMAPNMTDNELLLGMNVISRFKMIQDGESLQLILK